jgi:hypothetical protein
VPGAEFHAKAHLGPAEREQPVLLRVDTVGYVEEPGIYLHTACACFPWFISIGNRTQNSRLAGERPEIWSPPRAGLTVVCVCVCVNVCVCVVSDAVVSRAPMCVCVLMVRMNGLSKKIVFFLDPISKRTATNPLLERFFESESLSTGILAPTVLSSSKRTATNPLLERFFESESLSTGILAPTVLSLLQY